MHGQEGVHCRFPCCLSFSSPFPSAQMLPIPAESCFLIKLVICPLSHTRHALPTWHPAWQHPWPSAHHSEPCFHQNLGCDNKTKAHVQGREGPHGACFLILEKFSAIYCSVVQSGIAQHDTCATRSVLLDASVIIHVPKACMKGNPDHDPPAPLFMQGVGED